MTLEEYYNVLDDLIADELCAYVSNDVITLKNIEALVSRIRSFNEINNITIGLDK